MAKKLIQSAMQRFNMIPNKEKIAENKSLKFLGDKLHQPHLWHINRHSVARAFAVGGFAMYTPPLPWQMIIAAVLAVYFEANLPISVALVWITNPLTWIPLYYIAYSLGAMLTGREGYTFDDFKSVFDSLGDAWENLGAPFLVGCFGMMILCAIAGYFGIQAFWRYQVMSAWEKRKQRRREAQRRIFEGLPIDPEAELLPENQQAFIITFFETYWIKVGKPFVSTSLELSVIVANAALDGSRAFWKQATAAWEQHKTEKHETHQQSAETTSVETPSIPKENTLARLEAAWLNVGKPLVLDSFKMVEIFANAGNEGFRTFCSNAVQELEKRKSPQEIQSENFDPTTPEYAADIPDQQTSE